MNEAELRDVLKSIFNEANTDVIFENRPQKSELHPTMKPLPLIERFVLNSSNKGDVVFDPFGGSGTTLIACEEKDRRCRMIEIDPVYVDVIIERYVNFTGDRNGVKRLE